MTGATPKAVYLMDDNLKASGTPCLAAPVRTDYRTDCVFQYSPATPRDRIQIHLGHWKITRASLSTDTRLPVPLHVDIIIGDQHY